MTMHFSVRTTLRFFATTAFSIFSYAALAQPTLSMDACGQSLSSLQKRLYAHYLAGPDSLRDFVFSRRGIYLLRVQEVDAWARQVDAQGCAPGQASAASEPETGLAPTSESAPGVASAMSSVPSDTRSDTRSEAGWDGCTTNVLDVMRCTTQVGRTREAVVAELRNARAAGDVAKVGELSDATVSAVVPGNSAVALRRSDVKRELALAQASHELQFGER